jgi:transposase
LLISASERTESRDVLYRHYAGDGVPVVVDRLTGEIRNAQIFVAVLGASSFTFAHASWTQALPDWIDAHVRALETIGGVPHLLVPDNTKTAVIKACLYDPQVNRTYAEMAAHYDTAILPARPRRPRDKAKVEQAVLIVSASIRLTASSATGEIAAAFFPRRALAAMSASSKNCRLAWAQHSADVIAPATREGS